MNDETKKLLKQIKSYRDDMVARNYPFQEISDIIVKWEMKEVPDKDFLDEAERQNIHSLRENSTTNYIWTLYEPWDIRKWVKNI